MYYWCQINFSLFASTTALGISYLHTTKGDNLIKSIIQISHLLSNEKNFTWTRL